MKNDPRHEKKANSQSLDALFGEFTTHSAQETFELGREMGQQLRGGEILLLRGDLGAGKTVFAKGLAAGLGIDPADVTSPSFTLINVHEGRLRFYHIDLYRLDSGTHPDLGFDEIFDASDAATAVEWADRLRRVPKHAINVTIKYDGETDRRIVVDGSPAIN